MNGAHSPARAPVVPAATKVRRVSAACVPVACLPVASLPVMGLSSCNLPYGSFGAFSIQSARPSLSHARQAPERLHSWIRRPIVAGIDPSTARTLIGRHLRVICAASGLRGSRGNTLDLDQHARMRQRRDADQRACRRIFIAEIAGRNLVEDVLAVHLGGEDRKLHDILQLGAGGVEYLLDVDEGALGLLAEVARQPLPLVVGIVRVLVIGRDRATTREEDQPPALDRIGRREWALVLRPHRHVMDRLNLHALAPVALSGGRYPVRRRKRQMQTIVTTIISRNGPLDKKSNLNMFVSKFDQIVASARCIIHWTCWSSPRSWS